MDLVHPIHPALRGLVNRIEGYALRLDPAAVHHGVPSPAATVIISFEEPLDVGWLDEPDSHVQRWLLASGMHTHPALIRTHGVQHGIQVELSPVGCRALLGLPIGALARGLADHADVPLGIPPALHERLSAAAWPDRFRLLDAHLLGLAMRSCSEVPGDLAEAWRPHPGRGSRRLCRPGPPLAGVPRVRRADAYRMARRSVPNRSRRRRAVRAKLRP